MLPHPESLIMAQIQLAFLLFFAFSKVGHRVITAADAT
jgi:hypothetical protein